MRILSVVNIFLWPYSLLKSGVETRKVPSTPVDLVPLQLFYFWVDFLCYFALWEISLMRSLHLADMQISLWGTSGYMGLRAMVRPLV